MILNEKYKKSRQKLQKPYTELSQLRLEGKQPTTFRTTSEKVVSPSGNTPHPGLAGNPAKTRAIFSQDHPYFPKDCNHCAFYKPNIKSRLHSLFKAQVKDCYNCPYINGCIDRALGRHTEGYNMHEWKISYRSTKAEGYVITELQRLIEAEKSKQSIAIYKKELNT